MLWTTKYEDNEDKKTCISIWRDYKEDGIRHTHIDQQDHLFIGEKTCLQLDNNKIMLMLMTMLPTLGTGKTNLTHFVSKIWSLIWHCGITKEKLQLTLRQVSFDVSGLHNFSVQKNIQLFGMSIQNIFSLHHSTKSLHHNNHLSSRESLSCINNFPLSNLTTNLLHLSSLKNMIRSHQNFLTANTHLIILEISNFTSSVVNFEFLVRLRMSSSCFLLHLWNTFCVEEILLGILGSSEDDNEIRAVGGTTIHFLNTFSDHCWILEWMEIDLIFKDLMNLNINYSKIT